MEVVKSAYQSALRAVALLIGPMRVKQLEARVRWRMRPPSVRNPTSLGDKVCYLEFCKRDPRATRLTDKYDVRAYVKERGFGHTLIPLLLGPYSKMDDIPFADLPKRFVAKATHGCHMNIICRDVSLLDRDAMKRQVARWLSNDYGRAVLEPHYLGLRRRVVFEQLIGDGSDLVDYKIHCLNGEPAFILTCSNRENSLELGLHDTEWRPMSGLVRCRKVDPPLPTPTGLAKMLEMSRVLSEGIDFVRIDLYEVDKAVRFGEMTFSPAMGVFPYFSDEFQRAYGGRLTVEKL